MLILALAVAACGTDEAASVGSPKVVSALPPAPTTIGGVATTGPDGYPNINVDTARAARTPNRTAAEQDRLAADLMALSARQRSTADTSTPASVIDELQSLGRRSRSEAEKLIESEPPAGQ